MMQEAQKRKSRGKIDFFRGQVQRFLQGPKNPN